MAVEDEEHRIVNEVRHFGCANARTVPLGTASEGWGTDGSLTSVRRGLPRHAPVARGVER